MYLRFAAAATARASCSEVARPNARNACAMETPLKSARRLALYRCAGRTPTSNRCSETSIELERGLETALVDIDRGERGAGGAASDEKFLEARACEVATFDPHTRDTGTGKAGERL